MTEYQPILDFWFYPKDHELYGQKRAAWFIKDPDFDAQIRDRFLDLFGKAENGDLLQWTDSKEGCLALILLFDQFSRNMFRDDPKTFATDAKALEIAQHMITSGYFDLLPNFQKAFVILPFEHSENIDHQKFSVELFKKFGSDEDLQYAVQHHDIILQFDRFPHRNKILGRPSTKNEIEFLKQPNSSF